MAGPDALARLQALSAQEAFRIIEGLLDEKSTRLHSAQYDVVGKLQPDFVSMMLIAELARVVASQQERIEQLEAGLEATVKKSGK